MSLIFLTFSERKEGSMRLIVPQASGERRALCASWSLTYVIPRCNRCYIPG